jgi:hypothetical protein
VVPIKLASAAVLGLPRVTISGGWMDINQAHLSLDVTIRRDPEVRCAGVAGQGCFGWAGDVFHSQPHAK